ncbi:MlaD family protein [Tannerella forsythia]|jgi:mce family protein|uniref:MCE family protein n=2 Tax=Tannerella forsythia TaxID=28112 RepID=A0A2A6E7I5_TANFO|nr:MlaD family protein [Tannerella forsythia]KKY61259.1 mammalian cell entry protein [Tannerella forsythia]OLQ21030.1 mammalian cell entry protein [Tannerella forsythia]PDP43554.1 MCE family protein [Tannerella forsythia]PDP70609.1 MCE family protein [Tannerella forsythia]TPE17133.1 MCE family protein [Tannerella forsythia]
MKMKFSKEATIGVVSIISLVLLYIGVNYLKGINLFRPANHYYVACSNVKDVTISSPVFVEGFKVGLVRSISYDYSTTGKILVEISLEESMRINKGSYISLEKTLLSGGELHIHLNKYVDEYLKSGDTIEGRSPEDMMASVQEKMLPQIIDLLPKLDSILYSLQILVSHPALSQSLDHIEKTTASLEISSRRLNQLLGNDVPVIASNLKTTTDNFAALSEEMKNLNLKGSIQSLNLTIDNLGQTTMKLNAKDNSLGLLLNDTLLYNNLNETVVNASNLLIDLKQNPKRYVRFSLF